MTLDLSRLVQPEYWLEICPEMTINEREPFADRNLIPTDGPLRESDWETCKELISEDGYFAYDGWFHPPFVDRLAEGFDQLDRHGHHPIFSFVFDEYWELLVRLNPLFDDLVSDYWLLPAVWAWHVREDDQTAFSPHRDQAREADVDDEDHLDYLTIWIPLTDLNHLSSCMCVLPASADPDYDSGTARVTVENLQDVRTLQGSRGSVFCWTTGLIHWGTTQSRLGQPRKSIGVYIQNPEAECFDPPAMDFNNPLRLKRRLQIIGQQILDYSRQATEADLRLAQELMQLDA